MDVGEIWLGATGLLEAQVNRQTYDTWIAPLTLQSISGNQVDIAVPNRFFEEWLRAHYFNALISSFLSVFHNLETSLTP